MVLIRSLFLTIGVTLCVAPIFSSARAQGTTESRLLLELQALREEVAELRDMVERQQYQLQRMQRQATAPVAAPAERPAAPPAGNSAVAAPVAQYPASTDSQASGTRGQNGAPAAPDLPEDFYRPGAAQDPELVVSANETETASLPAVASDSRFPPVEERSVGVATTTPPTVIGPPSQNAADADPPAGVSLPPPALSEPTATPGQPADEQPAADAIPAGTASPVIAVPPAVSENTAAPDPSAEVTQAAPVTQGSPVAPQPRAVLSENEYYEQGFNLVKQGKFPDAIQVFQELIRQHPGGDLVGDAHYWIGESSFLDRDLETSKKYFKAFIESYPKSARLPGAMLRTAYIEQEQGNQMEARILLNEIIQYHPRSDAVHAARNRLAELQNQVN